MKQAKPFTTQTFKQNRLIFMADDSSSARSGINSESRPKEDSLSTDFMARKLKLSDKVANKLDQDNLREIYEQYKDQDLIDHQDDASEPMVQFLQILQRNQFNLEGKSEKNVVKILDILANGTAAQKKIINQKLLREYSQDKDKKLDAKTQRDLLDELIQLPPEDAGEEDIASVVNKITNLKTQANQITASAEKVKLREGHWHAEVVPQALETAAIKTNDQIHDIDREAKKRDRDLRNLRKKFANGEITESEKQEKEAKLLQEISDIDARADKLMRDEMPPLMNQYGAYASRQMLRFRAVHDLESKLGVRINQVDHILVYTDRTRTKTVQYQIDGLYFEDDDRNPANPGILIVEFTDHQGDKWAENSNNFIDIINHYPAYFEDIRDIDQLNQAIAKRTGDIELREGQKFSTYKLEDPTKNNKARKDQFTVRSIQSIDGQTYITLDKKIGNHDFPRYTLGQFFQIVTRDNYHLDLSQSEFEENAKKADFELPVESKSEIVELGTIIDATQTATISRLDDDSGQYKLQIEYGIFPAEVLLQLGIDPDTNPREITISQNDLWRLIAAQMIENQQMIEVDPNAENPIEIDSEDSTLANRVINGVAGMASTFAQGTGGSGPSSSPSGSASGSSSSASGTGTNTTGGSGGTGGNTPGGTPPSGPNTPGGTPPSGPQGPRMTGEPDHQLLNALGEHYQPGEHDAPASVEEEMLNSPNIKKRLINEEGLPYELIHKTGGMSKEEASYLRNLWGNTRFVSMGNIWEMCKTCYEYYVRRYTRNEKDRFANLAKNIPYFSSEMRRVRESTEHEEVEQFKSAMEDWGVYEIEERLQNTINKDEFKACMEVLTEKGQFNWDNIEFWKNLNRILKKYGDASLSIPIPSNGDPATEMAEGDKRTGRDFIPTAIDSLWGEGSFNNWYSKSKSSYDSNVKSFYAKGEELEGVQGGHGRALAELLHRHKMGEYVNPHEYEGLIMHAIEQGKSSYEAKVYYMVAGLAARNEHGRTILTFDRMAHINSKHLARFPLLEYMTASARRPDGTRHRWTIDDYRHWLYLWEGDMPMNTTPNARVMDFMWRNIFPSEYTQDRINKALRNPQEIDHDDSHALIPMGNEELVTDICKPVGGQRKGFTQEGYANAFPGYNHYMKILSEDDNRYKLMEVMKSYMRYESIMMNRFNKGQDNLARLGASNLTSETIVSSEPPIYFIRQCNKAMKEVINAYGDRDLIDMYELCMTKTGNIEKDSSEKKKQAEVNYALRNFGLKFDQVVRRDGGQIMVNVMRNANLTGMSDYISEEEKLRRKDEMERLQNEALAMREDELAG